MNFKMYETVHYYLVSDTGNVLGLVGTTEYTYGNITKIEKVVLEPKYIAMDEFLAIKEDFNLIVIDTNKKKRFTNKNKNQIIVDGKILFKKGVNDYIVRGSDTFLKDTDIDVRNYAHELYNSVIRKVFNYAPEEMPTLSYKVSSKLKRALGFVKGYSEKDHINNKTTTFSNLTVSTLIARKNLYTRRLEEVILHELVHLIHPEYRENDTRLASAFKLVSNFTGYYMLSGITIQDSMLYASKRGTIKPLVFQTKETILHLKNDGIFTFLKCSETPICSTFLYMYAKTTKYSEPLPQLKCPCCGGKLKPLQLEIGVSEILHDIQKNINIDRYLVENHVENINTLYNLLKETPFYRYVLTITQKEWQKYNRRV